MTDLNVVLLIGNLTRDSELKYTQGGMAISSFSIAVNRSRKQGEQYVDEVSFFDINLYGKVAESLQQYLLKGTKVAVKGVLKQDRWQNQQGATQSRVVINAESLQLIGAKREEPQSQYAQQYQQQRGNYQPRQNPPQPEYNPQTDMFPDEIPF